MVMFDMALKMDTNGGLLQTIDGHKFSPRHSMNKPFFFQIKDEIIIDVLFSEIEDEVSWQGASHSTAIYLQV